MIVLSELGTRLKQARIAKGLSLEDLQDLTKIQKRYLAGIEDGNHSMMPGTFYVRAFIKQYATAVGLNGEALLEEFQTDMPASEMVEKKPMPETFTSRSRSVKRTAPNETYAEIIPKVLVASFIVLILAVSWYFYSASTNRDTASRPLEDEGASISYDETAPASSKETEVVDSEETVEKPETATSVLSLKETKGETTTYTWQGTANPQLEIIADGPSWIAATDQNQQELTSKARVMQDGEKEILDLAEVDRVHVRIGEYANIKLAMNGENIEYTQQLQTQNVVIQLTNVE